MDRRPSAPVDNVRFRIDATRCDGQGVCVLIAPELFALDRYGLAYVVAPDRQDLLDPDIVSRGREADALCPRNAIREEVAPAVRPEPVDRAPVSATAAPRLLAEAARSVGSWSAAGGWAEAAPADDLIGLIERAGILGGGGAAFATGAKWRRVAGSPEPIVVVNGAEREPGTIKDRHLLATRPALVLDGMRLAMAAVGATEGHLAIDAAAVEARKAVIATLDDLRIRGLLDGLDIVVDDVPERYVAGEETALISLIGGGSSLPRLRPPYPSEVGVRGRPTLVNNVETVAQVAVAVALGADEFRSVGVPECPGSGLFSVGPFGGPVDVVERPYGYSLQALLEEHGLLAGAQAVLVGGYAGGLLTPDAVDIALTPGALTCAGASLGTKSIQVVGAEMCPIGVVAQIVTYFGAETADQCPPCSRGLPDMARILGTLESGAATRDDVDELRRFMSTLSDRGVCRLPDGAARVTLSLLTSFAALVDAHVGGRCPAQ